MKVLKRVRGPMGRLPEVPPGAAAGYVMEDRDSHRCVVSARYTLREHNWSEIEATLALGPFSLDYAVKGVSNAMWKHRAKLKRICRDIALKLVEALFALLNERAMTLGGQDGYPMGQSF